MPGWTIVSMAGKRFSPIGRWVRRHHLHLAVMSGALLLGAGVLGGVTWLRTGIPVQSAGSIASRLSAPAPEKPPIEGTPPVTSDADDRPQVYLARLGERVEWSAQYERGPATYRWDDIEVTIRSDPAAEEFQARPILTIRAPGRPPQRLEGTQGPRDGVHLVAAGFLDRRGTRFVYYQGHWGGAHCCNVIKVAVVEPQRIRVAELGNFNSSYRSPWPRHDEDGDGTVDFVEEDEEFDYAFSSYAGSWSPPQILNVIDGRAVDVSRRPAFRRFFEQDVQYARLACIAPVDEGATHERNGVCAGYVGSAARLGRFRQAWAEMLGHYDREHGNDYPRRLRQFLSEHGYIGRGAG